MIIFEKVSFIRFISFPLIKDQSCDSNFSSIKFLSASSYFQIVFFVCLSFVGFIVNFCSYCAMITIEGG